MNPAARIEAFAVRKTWLVILAVACLAVGAAAVAASAATSGTAGTIYACVTSTRTLVRVQTSGPPSCPAGSFPVSWAATVPGPSPSPSPTSTTPAPTPTDTTPSPTPTGTTVTPSPTPTGTGTLFSCVTGSPSGNCGPYDYAGITNSNGYNTYVGNNCWADPSCAQTVSANNPGDWQVVSSEPSEPGGNTPGNCANGVKTYPDAQQLFNDWTGGGWNAGPNMTDTPVSGLSRLTSDYAESTPGGPVIAQFAYDIWTSGNAGHPGEVMIWTDNQNRQSGGATQVAGPVSIGGQDWTAYQYGTGEFIWSLGAPGTFARQPAGTVDILALLQWMQANGFMAAGASVGQIDAGWEICSTGGAPATFTVSRYTLTAAAA